MKEINSPFGKLLKINTITLELNARKSMAGDIMIFDHAYIDIVLVLKEGKGVYTIKYVNEERVFKYI